MKDIGTITLHDKRFRIRENSRLKDRRLCIEILEDGIWLRVCRCDCMEDVLWWLRLYEIGRVRLEDCEEYQKALKGRGKDLEEKR